MKALATLTAASILAFVGAASAQTTTPPAPGAPPATTAPSPDRATRGPGLSRADADALTDARMASIQAGLKLNPEQQRLWTPVEAALRAQAAARADRFEERRRMMGERRDDRGEPDQRRDITQRLERRAEWANRRAQRTTEHAQRVTALSNAMKPFYASLDDNQKRLLPVLMRQGRWSDHRMGMHRYGHHDGRDRGMDGRGMMDRDRGTERGMMERGPQRYH
jgi:hypothetical protein